MCAMPSTIVQDTSGPTTTRISLMKPSPSGFSATSVAGSMMPTMPPAMIASSTRK